MGPPDPRASTLAHLSCSHIQFLDVGLKGCAMRLHPARVQPSFFFARSPKRKKMVMSTLKKKMVGERFQDPKTRTLAYPGSNMQTDQIQLESSAMPRRTQINNKHAKRHTGGQLNPANIKNSTVESSESSKRQTKTDAFSARPSKLCTLR